ncbi:MAG TPA: sugar-binding protein [Anaerolineaceae bacterium]
MRRPSVFTPLFFILLAFSLAGCSLPISPTAVQGPEPTSTAAQPVLVVPTQAIPPTVTTLPTEAPTEMPTASPSPAPTSTPQATSTPLVQTPTPAPISTSAPITRSSVTAASLSTPPTINGPWDEWKTTQFPIKTVIVGAANWTGPSDLQAAYRVGWDSKNLYLAVKVTDDVYVQNATGADLFKGDSIEILFSTNPNADSTSGGLTANDYQIGISPGRPSVGQNMEAYRWFPKAKAGSLTNVTIGAVSTSDGYRIEFAIPWSDLGVTPAKGKVYGWAVSVSDNDNKTQNLQQTLISSAPNRRLIDPTTWGLLTLG